MYHNFFIHSSVDGHLGCFYLLAIVNCAAVNFHWQVFVWMPVFNSFEYFMGVELLGYMVILCLNFWGPAKQFFMAGAPFYIPTSNVKCCNFSTFLSTLVIFFCCCCCYSYPSVYEVLIVILACISLMTDDVQYLLFSCSCGPFVYFLWRNTYLSPLSIFNWVVCHFVVE